MPGRRALGGDQNRGLPRAPGPALPEAGGGVQVQGGLGGVQGGLGAVEAGLGVVQGV